MLDIKSDLKKVTEKMNVPIFGPLMAGIIGGLVIGILCVSFGASTFIKIVVLVLGTGFIIIIVGSDTKTPTETEDNVREGKMFAGVMVIAFIVAEIGLFLSTTESTVIPITVVKNNTTVLEKVQKDIQCGSTRDKPCAMKTIEVPHVVISYFKPSLSSAFKSFTVKESNTELIALHLSVTSIKYYFEYVPFFKYSEASEYVREKK